MARQPKKSRKKPARRLRPKTEWLGTTMPLSVDCDLVVWVDRQTSELLDAQLCRSSRAELELERAALRALEQRGKPPGRLRVPDAATARRLRKAFEGAPVVAGFDAEAERLLETAASSACCLQEEVAVNLAGGEPTYTLKVTLRDIEPPIWRRVRVAGDASLGVLHAVLQAAMGWQDYHLHQFEVHGERYGEIDEDAPATEHDEHSFQIGKLLKKGDGATYWYDFGDDWKHDIVVEQIGTAAEGDPVATCLAGARACPPEDAGGPWGYEEKLRARAEPQDEDDHLVAEWLGEDFDPEAFDCDKTDARVRAVFVVRRRRVDYEEDEADWIDDDDSLDADGECLYDADRGPEPEQWLELDEGEQHYHVKLHHMRSKEPLPPAGGFRAHAVLHSAVETQIAADNPAIVRKTLVRLLGEGLGRHEAIHAIASVLAAQLYDLVCQKDGEQPEGFDELGYARELKSLNARDWLGQ